LTRSWQAIHHVCFTLFNAKLMTAPQIGVDTLAYKYNLESRNRLGITVCMLTKAASVLLRLFTKGNEIFHNTDPPVLKRNFIFKCKQVQYMIREDRIYYE